MEGKLLKAVARTESGKRGSRRVRDTGMIPINMYGRGINNMHLQVSADDLNRLVHGGQRMISLEVDGAENRGMLKEVQFDALSGGILHADFARVELDQVVDMQVAVRSVGTAKGVAQGGILDIVQRSLPLRGPVKSMPESVDLDVSSMGLAVTMRVKHVNLPEGVVCTFREEEPVVIVQPPRGMKNLDPKDFGEE